MGKSCYRLREGATCRNITVSSDSLKLVIGGLTSVILIVLGTVSLYFQGWFVSISWGHGSELGQLVSWLWSGHCVLDFFHLVQVPVSANSSQDTAQTILYSPWEGTKGPWLCLMTTLLLLFVLLWLFSLVSTF